MLRNDGNKRKVRPQVTEPRNIKAREREVEALELRKAGATYRMIGHRLGISAPAAHKRVMDALHSIAETTSEKAADVLAIETERLDSMLLGLWEKARRGDVAAVDRVVRIMQRRADMLGIDAASKHEVTGKDGNPIVTREVTDKTVADIRRRMIGDRDEGE